MDDFPIDLPRAPERFSREPRVGDRFTLVFNYTTEIRTVTAVGEQHFLYKMGAGTNEYIGSIVEFKVNATKVPAVPFAKDTWGFLTSNGYFIGLPSERSARSAIKSGDTLARIFDGQITDEFGRRVRGPA